MERTKKTRFLQFPLKRITHTRRKWTPTEKFIIGVDFSSSSSSSSSSSIGESRLDVPYGPDNYCSVCT
jgi:hypothetical protein